LSAHAHTPVCLATAVWTNTAVFDAFSLWEDDALANESTRRTPMRTTTRNRIQHTIVTGMAATMLATIVPPAEAATGTYIAATASVLDCHLTNLACGKPFTTLPTGTRVTMDCYVDGTRQKGRYATTRYFHLVAANGVTGIVHASYVEQQTTVRRCQDVKALWAAIQAATRVGQVQASDTDARQFTAADWSPGPYGEWSGDCPKLGAVAWAAAGVGVKRGNAIGQYRAYKDAGMIRQGTPPPGALVFFDIAQPYGHTGVSMGGGRIATTRGVDNDRQPNAAMAISSYSNYLGWAMPDGSSATAAPAPPPSTSTSNLGTTLRAGATMKHGQYLTNNSYKFVFQADQNVVLYNRAGRAIWSSRTNGSGADRLVMQRDGNLVAYRGSRAIWASNTDGRGGNRLAMQSDGNAVVYTAANRPVWATGTNGR
jgi:hypothetical protein